MQIGDALRQAAQSIQNTLELEPTEASFEANLLCQQVLNVNRAWLIGHETDALEANQQAGFEALVQRRLNGEPIAYILGSREFYGLPLKTTPATLIPRPDTETLVEAALAKIPQNVSLNILDLGTGTGAVALAIASQLPQTKVIAVDASLEALKVAIENAQSLNLSNVHLIESNWFSALVSEKFDVIVSNPPYIAQDDEHLKLGDLRFEPLSALASGVDGLDDIRKIIQDAPEYLNPNGWLMLEHGYDQADAVAALLKARGFSQIDHARDIAGTQRVTFGAI
ncbi:peptide chain release factor N(5)-glutamine methyltransferase [Candidatus Methylopumilus turicensis]|uniref:Release factor glutamine methyltransferase n=1 Tax=Candidatus Methylopumilus turicensis TaxID=1581680 RepID=A0A0B7J1S1_9PROT|nr:peptide chain release factor N(5)-glutamine methyltransferase [Candidatus Methylopumilus turicensis]CEN56653.1 Release factor glutamine methyltransferase [Candidatus Methylopumilus turicensis]